MMMQQAIIRTLLILAGFSLSACGWEKNSEKQSHRNSQSSNDQIPAVHALAALRNEIQTLIIDLSCSKDAECKLVGLGYEPCGHPTKFLPYSLKNLDEGLLAAKIRLHKQTEKAHFPAEIGGGCGYGSPRSPQCLPKSDGSSHCTVTQDASFAEDSQILWWGL